VVIQNMGTLDRSLRIFVVAPVAIVVALILGAGTVAGIILFVVAGIMLATAVTAFCPTYTSSASRRTRAVCIASAMGTATATPDGS
jgi:Protein of unknown function (DUF2892)